MEENNVIEINNPQTQEGDKITFEKVENDELVRLKVSADVFGVSARELESEFIDFKTEKLLKRFDYLLCESVGEIGIKNAVQMCKGMGFGSITVLPAVVSSCKKYIAGANIKVNSLVAYPFGEEFSNTKICSVRQLVRSSVSAISTPITPLMLNFYRMTTTTRELKKMRKIAKSKRFNAIVSIDDMSAQMLSSLIKLVTDVGFDAICVNMQETSIPKLKQLFDMSAGKFDIEVMGDISLKLGIATLNFGVKKICATNAENLAEELIAKLK